MLAIGLASAAALTVEIVLTRLYSVVLAYPFVYLLLSVAVLGLGLGAWGAHWWRRRLQGSGRPSRLLLVGAGEVILLMVLFLGTVSQRWWPVYLLLGCAVFAPVGAFFSGVFSRQAEQSGRLYWADLTGAALGVLVAYGALLWMGAVNAMLLGALLLVGGALAYRPSRLSWGAAVALMALLVLNVTAGLVDLDLARTDSSKTIARALDPAGLQGEVILSDWDPYARTDAVAYPGLPDERTLFVDGGSGSAVFRASDGLESLSYLRDDLGYLPFRVLQPGSVYIIGPGGGKDIALALLAQSAGSVDVTAVEINPGIVRALDAMGDYNGRLHRQPGVDLIVGEGRSFLKQGERSYDLIYLSLVANEAADLAGLALSENYVYTEEAFVDYLDHLTGTGAVAMRLHDQPHLERAFVTALQALVSTGLPATEAMRQIVIVAGLPHPESGAQMDPLLLIFRSPVPEPLATEMLAQVELGGIFPFFVPGVREGMPYAAFAQGQIELDEFVHQLGASYGRPTTDDRPFFYLLQDGLPPELVQLGVLLMVAIAGWAVYLSRQRVRRGLVRRRVYWWAFFAALGLGFMMLELALIQRFALFLGHPVRSLVVVLGALLIATGLGSAATRHLVGRSAQMLLQRASAAVVLLGGLYLVWFPGLLSAFHGAGLATRMALAVGLTAVLGFLLGTFFPAGLRLLGTEQGGDDVALAWATNGLFSVAGSVLAMAVAIAVGFNWVWVAGSAGYLVVAGLVWGPLRQRA
jgi:predicted membrane-bound spermidine synthase